MTASSPGLFDCILGVTWTSGTAENEKKIKYVISLEAYSLRRQKPPVVFVPVSPPSAFHLQFSRQPYSPYLEESAPGYAIKKVVISKVRSGSEFMSRNDPVNL